MNDSSNHFYEFEPFRLDANARQLLRGEEPVAISSKVFDLLLIMVQSGGELITKDHLMDRLWPDTAVEEHNLTQNISVLRKILGETPTDHRYIVTVPGTGYRFVAAVTEVAAHTDISISEEELPSRISSNGQIAASARAPLWRPIPARAFQTALALLIIVLSLPWIVGNAKKAESDSGIRSIAILPFKSLDSESCKKQLMGVLTDAVITRLVQVGQMKVSPISDVVKYDCSKKDLATIGRELKVDVLLEGKIQQTGDRIRITVQLLRTQDGSPVWSEKFDTDLTDRFELQDFISEQIAQALTSQLAAVRPSDYSL